MATSTVARVELSTPSLTPPVHDENKQSDARWGQPQSVVHPMVRIRGCEHVLSLAIARLSFARVVGAVRLPVTCGPPVLELRAPSASPSFCGESIWHGRPIRDLNLVPFGSQCGSFLIGPRRPPYIA